jgi:hypothetical protein
MHDICDTREMCEARQSRSSRACRASSRDPCMRDVWGMPRPADLRACEASDPVGHYTRVRFLPFIIVSTPQKSCHKVEAQRPILIWPSYKLLNTDPVWFAYARLTV